MLRNRLGLRPAQRWGDAMRADCSRRRRRARRAGLAGPAPARDLTVVSWGGAYQDAQREIYFEPFTAADGHQAGRGQLERRRRRAARQGRGRQCRLGRRPGRGRGAGARLRGGPVRAARLGGARRQGAVYLPAAVHDCGVGAIVWSTVLAYDGDKIGDKAPTDLGRFLRHRRSSPASAACARGRSTRSSSR